jgi:hypothetical protein
MDVGTVIMGIIQKIHLHVAPWTTAPPRNGPMPLPSAMTAPSQPI